MNAQNETIAVDASPLISTLLGGRARLVLFSPQFSFITTEFTTWEVKKYIPLISTKTDIPEIDLITIFERTPIVARQSFEYDSMRGQASKMIAQRDPKDVNILALALQFNIPIWSEDKDLISLKEIEVLTTADMFEKLDTFASEL